MLQELQAMQVPPNHAIPGFYTSDYVHPKCRPYSLRKGHSQALILLHGLTGTPNDFEAYAKPFAEYFDVFVPLLPGHGSHVCHLQNLGIRELMIPLPALHQHLSRLYQNVHVVGMSYGAILAVASALKAPPKTLSLVAPAFSLTPRAEQRMVWIRRLKMHRWLPRLRKVHLNRRKPFPLSNPLTYKAHALTPTEALHRLAQDLIPQLHQLDMPIWHAHGTHDDTTPVEPNHRLLRARLRNYHFCEVASGPHVLTLGPHGSALATQHLQWLQRHTID